MSVERSDRPIFCERIIYCFEKCLRLMKVLIANDRELIRAGMVPILKKLGDDVEIVEASNFSSAFRIATEEKGGVSLILVDLMMPEMKGSEGVSALCERLPETPIVVLSAIGDHENVVSAIDAGAAGYITETLPGEIILNALRLVLSGGKYLPLSLLDKMDPAMTTNAETASKEGIPKTAPPLFLGGKEEGVQTMEQSPGKQPEDAFSSLTTNLRLSRSLPNVSRGKPQPIKWRAELSVDQGIIDADHRYVIATINRFRERVGSFKTSDDALETLKDVRFYVEKHFTREETLLRMSRYPYLHALQQQHSYLIKTLDNVIAEIKPATGFGQKWQTKRGGNDINTAGEQLGQFIGDWFIDHVIKTDVRMKPYVAKMKDHAAKMEKLETYRRK